MLSLDSPRWGELQHAYDLACDIPALLSQLETLPAHNGNKDLWYSLWSALVHRGDVYPASFAAAPYFETLRQLPALIASAASRDWNEEFMRPFRIGRS